MQWVLLFHVVLGTVWLGGAIYQETLVSAARRESREAHVRTAIRTAMNNARIYPVVTMLVMATAVWMILARSYLDWTDGWIIASIVLWLAGVLLGIFYFTPQAKQLAARLEAEGPTESVGIAAERMLKVASADIIMLLALLTLMIFKPGS